MAKNNKLINNMLAIARRNREQNIIAASNDIVPSVYAGIALALHERGWGYQRISSLFADSQRIWAELEDNSKMIELCEEKTGIKLMNPEQAEKYENS